jgi:proteasome lid subunit RPN8/RPN11
MKKHTGEPTQGGIRGVERCWVLIGRQEGGHTWRFRRRCPSFGGPASVEASWEWALEREERHGDVIGFFHTHPAGAGTQPSSRDVRTMLAWRSALGKPLLCVIAAGKAVEGFVFTKEDPQAIQVESVLKGEKGWYTVQIG